MRPTDISYSKTTASRNIFPRQEKHRTVNLSFERRKPVVHKVNIEGDWRVRKAFITEKLSPIQKAIQESRYILDLQDNWDDEGSVGYEFSTWERATQAIIRIARNAFDLFDVIIDAPEITHGPNGSIDALWDQKNYRLLVNFPNDINIPASFYGDDSEKESVKGTFGQSEGGCNLLFYLVGTKRCSP